MESLDRAVSLSRALLALHRSEQSGVLHVRSGPQACRFTVVRGVVRAANGELAAVSPLGDELVSAGALDLMAHRRALMRCGLPDCAVGAWLVSSGLVSHGAVERALRRQLRGRLRKLLECPLLEYRFERGGHLPGAPISLEPEPTVDLVLCALRAHVAELDRDKLAQLTPPGRLDLTATGSRLLRTATLWPDESVALSMLERGATMPEVLAVSGGSRRVTAAMAAWSLLGLTRQRSSPSDGRYALLLRKRRQLRSGGDARDLLDLGDAGERRAARRALRALARRLHPDGLGPDARPELRRASNEVLCGLIEAERRFIA